MIDSSSNIAVDLIKRILFKLKGNKTGFQKEAFISLDEVKNTHTYSNINLIDHIFNKAKKAREKGHYEQDSIISNRPKPNQFFIEFLLYDYIDQIQFNKKIKVLDYGGSFGNTFFALEKHLNLKFDWYVYDQKKKNSTCKKK